MSKRNAHVARVFKILTLLEGSKFGMTVTEIFDRLQSWSVEQKLTLTAPIYGAVKVSR